MISGSHTPAERAWSFIVHEIRGDRPFPATGELEKVIGRTWRGSCRSAMYKLAALTVIRPFFRRGAGARVGYELTPYGRWAIETNYDPFSEAAHGSASEPAGDSPSSPESPAPSKSKKPRGQKARKAPRKRSDRVVAARI